MIKYDINTIPLLTLQTFSITHPVKYTNFYLKSQFVCCMISYNL